MWLQFDYQEADPTVRAPIGISIKKPPSIYLVPPSFGQNESLLQLVNL